MINIKYISYRTHKFKANLREVGYPGWEILIWMKRGMGNRYHRHPLCLYSNHLNTVGE